jgi:hypothetical protein
MYIHSMVDDIPDSPALQQEICPRTGSASCGLHPFAIRSYAGSAAARRRCASRHRKATGRAGPRWNALIAAARNPLAGLHPRFARCHGLLANLRLASADAALD